MVRLLLIVVVLLVFAQPAESIAASFNVPQDEEATRILRLVVEDRVLVKFTVVAQNESILDFSITDPNQGLIVELKRSGSVEYSFVCDQAGEYILHFSNIGYSESKLVTLDYEIQHYIFGIPQMLFLTIMIVLVCLGAVATFIIMGKPH